MPNSNPHLTQTYSSASRAPTVSPEARRTHDEIEFYNELSEDLRHLYEPSDGRTRPEHASFLNSISKEARDLYERGATIYGDTLIIPRESVEKLDRDDTIRLGTHAHAVREFTPLIGEEEAKRAASEFIELGRAIAGRTADSKTRLVVFQNFYREITRDEKGKILSSEEQAGRLPTTLEKMRAMAGAMRAEEWAHERGEFVSIEDWECGSEERQRDSEHETHGRLTYRIAENYGLETERGEIEEGRIEGEREPSFKLPEIAYERVSLRDVPPRLPDSLSAEDERRLWQEVIPRLDRQIETGARPRDCLSALRREQRAAELAARTERVARIFANGSPTSNLEKAVTRRDELRALYALQLLVPDEARFGETREVVARLISERAPSPRETFAVITDTGARLAHEYRQQTARLVAYEKAESQRAKLETEALQFRESVRRSNDFQTAQRRLATDGRTFKLQENAALSSTSTHQTKPLPQVSNYPDLTGEKPTVSEYARLHASHVQELYRTRHRLAEMLIDPAIESAQAANAIEIEQHRAYFSRLAGREIENANDARSTFAPHHKRTRDVLHRLHAERSRLNVAAPSRTPAEQSSSRSVFVAFSGDEAKRLPLASFGEFQVFARFAREAKLPVRVFESPNSSSGRDEIIGASDSRAEFYDFAREYVSYRMKDETTHHTNEHRLFREFAARLDSARDCEELRQTLNDIRRENYDRAKHPERYAEERRELSARDEQTRRPLNHSEMRSVLIRPAPSHYTDEMREMRLSRSQNAGDRAARIKRLEQTEASRSPELQTLMIEFARARHDDPTRFMRNINSFLGDYLNPPDVKPTRFSSNNLYEIGKRLQPVERDFLFKFIGDTKTALISHVPVKDIKLAAFDEHNNQARQIDSSNRLAVRAQANGRAALESPTLRQFLGASLWREAELIVASQNSSSTFSQDARVTLTEREIEAVAHLLTEHHQQSRHLDSVAQYLNTSDDSQRKRLGEVLTTFREMRAASAGDEQIRFEITAAKDSLLARDEWTTLLDFFSTRLSDRRPLNLPDTQRRDFKREAIASAWREIRPQELRQPEKLLDAPPEALAHAIAAHREIEQGRALQQSTRTAANVLTARFNTIASQTARELAKTDPLLVADQQRVEAAIKLALAADATPNIITNMADERDQAQRELVTHASRAISPRDREQYRMLADFAARAKQDYVEHFLRIDKRLAALTLSARESRSLMRDAAQTGKEHNDSRMNTFAAREDITLGRELGQLIKSSEAEELMDRERVEKADRVRDLLPKDVRERARETASHTNGREVQAPSSMRLLETLEERVSGYLTLAVREGGTKTLRSDHSASRHAQQVTRIIVETLSEHGRDLSASSDNLRFVEATAAKLVDEISAAFHERTRAVGVQDHEYHLGEIVRRDHLSPQFAARHDGSDAHARKALREDTTERTLDYNHEKEIVVQGVSSAGERTHDLSMPPHLQSVNSNTERSLHKPTAPEIAADSHDQHFRHYVLTR